MSFCFMVFTKERCPLDHFYWLCFLIISICVLMQWSFLVVFFFFFNKINSLERNQSSLSFPQIDLKCDYFCKL